MPTRHLGLFTSPDTENMKPGVPGGQKKGGGRRGVPGDAKEGLCKGLVRQDMAEANSSIQKHVTAQGQNGASPEFVQK